MRPCKNLPEGYEKIFTIDLSNNKKLFLLVNVGAAVIAILMMALVLPFKSIGMLFDMSSGMTMYALRFSVIIAGSVVYIILHELVHGFFFRMYSGEKAFYGFKLSYAYAGSKWFYDKKSYLVIALSPVIIWGLVLSVLCIFVPRDFFWSVYFIQIMNISGAAGDLYVTYKMLRLPQDILVRDSGTSMEIFSRAAKNEE
ncbi:MAG: DUF3267 domain-containing protein [Clostridia bacterium]|nr:DUF3267 domain-containing protein [Clostridia bacterium]